MNIKLVFALTVVIVGVSRISAQLACQVCMPKSQAYCVDRTSYYICLDGENPINTTLNQCDKGQVCTDSINICEPEIGNDGVVNRPACSSSCGVCPDPTEPNNRYTCVAKDQFGVCVRNKISATSRCEAGQICSSELYQKTGVICAPECVTNFYGFKASCDSEDVVTTTTTTTAPVNPESIRQQCEAALPNYPDVRTFYIANTNDNECKTYIYCEKFGNDVDGLLVKCASGNYFDPSEGKCKNQKPLICNPTTLAPTTTTIAPTTPTTSAPTTTTIAPTTPTTSAPTTTTVNPNATE